MCVKMEKNHPQIERFRGIINGQLKIFGNGKYDAAMNMAIDEAMMRLSDQNGTFMLRTYEFIKPSVVLSFSDSTQNILSQSDIDVTRRISAGKPIYIDKNVLAYSITGPMHSPYGFSPTDLHKVLGSIISDSIERTVKCDIRLSLGNAYSIRYLGLPIVGNGQHIGKMHSFLYHGVIALGPWDHDNIRKVLRINDSDLQTMQQLPSISQIGNYKKDIQIYRSELCANIIDVATEYFKTYSVVCDQNKSKIIEDAKIIAEQKYKANEWIARTDIPLRVDSRFCLLYEG